MRLAVTWPILVNLILGMRVYSQTVFYVGWDGCANFTEKASQSIMNSCENEPTLQKVCYMPIDDYVKLDNSIYKVYMIGGFK